MLTLADSPGDGGGTLTINGAIYGASIALSGADVDIGNAGGVGSAVPQPVVETFADAVWPAHPIGLAFDSAGNLFVANFSTSSVSKVTPAGVVSLFFNGLPGPKSVCLDTTGNIYVVCTSGNDPCLAPARPAAGEPVRIKQCCRPRPIR